MDPSIAILSRQAHPAGEEPRLQARGPGPDLFPIATVPFRDPVFFHLTSHDHVHHKTIFLIVQAGKHLESIREEIESLDNLIGRILILTKMDYPESPTEISSIHLEELLAELIKRFGTAVAE